MNACAEELLNEVWSCRIIMHQAGHFQVKLMTLTEDGGDVTVNKHQVSFLYISQF